MPIVLPDLRRGWVVAKDASISHLMRSTEGGALGFESRDDRVFRSWRARRDVLLSALDGVELSADEDRLVEWLAGWDDWTATTTAMLISAVRAAEAAEAAE